MKIRTTRFASVLERFSQGFFETVTPDGVLNDQVSESTSSFLLQLREIQKEAESKTSEDVSAPAEEEEEDS